LLKDRHAVPMLAGQWPLPPPRPASRVRLPVPP
jgi:hypothetical protein